MKNALLIKGEPRPLDDPNKFEEVSNKNLEIMSEILSKEGYSLKEGSLDRLFPDLGNYASSENFLFYFTGHSSKDHLGRNSIVMNDVLKSIGKINGKKIIVLDSCIGDYEGSSSFEGISLPKMSKIIGAAHVYRESKSIVTLLHDIVLTRNISLDAINQNTFDELKYNWVYFKETI